MTPLVITVAPDAPAKYRDLAAIFAEMVALADDGAYTGPTVVNWKAGAPTSVKGEVFAGPATGWRFSRIGGAE